MKVWKAFLSRGPQKDPILVLTDPSMLIDPRVLCMYFCRSQSFRHVRQSSTDFVLILRPLAPPCPLQDFRAFSLSLPEEPEEFGECSGGAYILGR